MTLFPVTDPVESRMREIAQFQIPCPLHDRKKSVAPVTCRNCSQKKTCPEIQELLGAGRGYALKFKGTLLESAMKRAGESKRKAAEFVLEG
ncbi:MAG: hypothetical protein V1820_03100 [archaeon]